MLKFYKNFGAVILVKAFLYLTFFLLGIGVGIIYFNNLWKSVNAYKSDKSKIIFSSFLRFPLPIIAAIIAGLFSGIAGIIAVILGFSIAQVYYLVKRGSQLKQDLEEYAKQLEEENKNGNKS
ncbi:hypothetical protein HG1285_12157 [Hydrogenivirga sp. 128-5-R1-1]|nr:hypothetical protein HG1285_12157 [Hydrogenivirga sp. 128-5-R1-1]